MRLGRINLGALVLGRFVQTLVGMACLALFVVAALALARRFPDPGDAFRSADAVVAVSVGLLILLGWKPGTGYGFPIHWIGIALRISGDPVLLLDARVRREGARDSSIAGLVGCVARSAVFRSGA